MKSDEVHIFLEVLAISLGIVLCMSEGNFVLISALTDRSCLSLIETTHEAITLIP